MKYMVDANLHGLAKFLKREGIDCETSTKLIRGDEDTGKEISDAKIFKFVFDKQPLITLITSDNDLSEYCIEFAIPYVKVKSPEQRNWKEVTEEVIAKIKSS